MSLKRDIICVEVVDLTVETKKQKVESTDWDKEAKRFLDEYKSKIYLDNKDIKWIPSDRPVKILSRFAADFRPELEAYLADPDVLTKDQERLSNYVKDPENNPDPIMGKSERIAETKKWVEKYLARMVGFMYNASMWSSMNLEETYDWTAEQHGMFYDSLAKAHDALDYERKTVPTAGRKYLAIHIKRIALEEINKLA
jgi:hypothetical protein